MAREYGLSTSKVTPQAISTDAHEYNISILHLYERISSVSELLVALHERLVMILVDRQLANENRLTHIFWSTILLHAWPLST